MKEKSACVLRTINKACLIVKSDFNEELILKSQTTDCENCPLEDVLNITAGAKHLPLTVDAVYPTRLAVVTQDGQTILNETEYRFREWGRYNLSFDHTAHTRGIAQVEEPVNPYIPIYAAIGFFVFLSLLVSLVNYLRRKEWVKRAVTITRNIFCYSGQTWTRLHEPAAAATPKSRLRSLDIFRGLAIVIMIFVNYKGGHYWIFTHSTWNGLTIADLVFPWFMWIMGTTLAIWMRSRLRNMVPRLVILRKIVKRSLILFFLGLVVNTLGHHIDMELLRIPGVLQRFAISYMVVASVHLCFAQPVDVDLDRWWECLRDVYRFWGEWLVMVVLVAVHLVVTFMVAPPGCHRGYLGPGGLHDNGSHENCTGGAAGYIDRLIFTPNHIYQGGHFKEVYHSPLPHDPEGSLGCLTSIFLVFLGLQAGKILLCYQLWKQRVGRWLCWALVTGAIALVLTQGTLNYGWIPVNKNLWSVSFILLMAASSFLLLSIFYLVVDVWHLWDGFPLVAAGMNPILLYMGHEIMDSTFPFAWKIPEGSPHWHYLLTSLWGAMLWVVIAVVLARKNIFLAI